MPTVDTLLHCRWLLPIAPLHQILEHQTVAIKNGKILAVGPKNSMRDYNATETVTLNDHVVMPGFVNTHTHAAMNLFRGLSDDVDFTTWLFKNIIPAEQQTINEDAIAAGNTLAIAEMLRTGTTTFNDHYFLPHITAKQVIDSGIRANLGLQIYNVKNQWANDAEHAMDRGMAIYKEHTPHDRITWALAPHAPYSVTDDNFRRIKKLSETHDLRVHIHLCESAGEIDESIHQHKMRPIERMDKLGLLNDKLIAVHMVHLTHNEMKRLAEVGAHIVHCPESNMKLANGIAPVVDLLEHNINVSLATDGAASNNDLDMLGEARTASLAAKAITQDPEALSAMQLLKMMTINGAKALGLDDKIGSIEAGKAADIIAIDLSDNLTQPVYNTASHLVYCACKTDVSDVWVNGERLLNHKTLTRFDRDELKQTAEVWQKKIVEALQ